MVYLRCEKRVHVYTKRWFYLLWSLTLSDEVSPLPDCRAAFRAVRCSPWVGMRRSCPDRAQSQQKKDSGAVVPGRTIFLCAGEDAFDLECPGVLLKAACALQKV